MGGGGGGAQLPHILNICGKPCFCCLQCIHKVTIILLKSEKLESEYYKLEFEETKSQKFYVTDLDNSKKKKIEI